MGKLILRFDDIAPGMAWSKFLPLKKYIAELGIRSVLGVVPECRDPGLRVEPDRPDFFNFVREWSETGDTIAQHGTYHLYDSNHTGMLGLQNRSEFAGHPYSIQLDRLALGKRILRREGVWQPYFMAPSHSFDHNTLRALDDLDFIVVTDGFGFYPYHVNGILLVPQLTARPLNIKFGVQTICVHINGMTESEIQSFLNFIRFNRSRFVDFKAIITQPTPDSISHSLLRSASSTGVKSARMLRNSISKIKRLL